MDSVDLVSVDSPNKENEDVVCSQEKLPISDDAPSIAVVWEYEVALNEWVRYENGIISELNNSSEDGVVKTTVEDSELHLDIASMKQINMVSGFRRNMRCAISSNDDGVFYTWDHMKGRRYSPFSKTNQILLETAKGNSKSCVVLTIDDITWTVNLDTMRMSSADKEVKLRRNVSEADSAMTALPAPSSDRTRALTRRSTKSVDYKKEIKEEMDDDVKEEPVIQKKSRGRKHKAEIDDEEDEDVLPIKKSNSKSASGVQKSTKRTVIRKGRAAVDCECHEKVKVAHVLDEGNCIWDAMLNQTNISNNNNKFYILQLLEDDTSKHYSVWFRWGRVGYTGQSDLKSLGGDLEQAKKIFCKKFSDKTGNDWSERNDFDRIPGKYTLITVDYTGGENLKEPKDELKEEDADQMPRESSKLDDRIQSLLALICNLQTMEEAVTEMEYDSAKAPLGKLTPEQITEGYRVLGEISKFVEKKNFGRDFVETVNEYYTKVPHAFGFKQPPLIKTQDELKKEMDLLEMLETIEIAIRTLGANTTSGDRRALVDVHYDNMKCSMKPLEKTDRDYQMVELYLKNTHAATHMYSMKIRNIFDVNREGEAEGFQRDLGNRQLLWHGSRITNWYGILSKGLRIAPPEAPSCGYMFGKGVYFADMASKSGNYCYPVKGKSGIIMLAEVALGTPHELRDADYNADRLPKGKHSTMGAGKTYPNPKDMVTLDDGVIVPCGRPLKKSDGGQYSLLYNEFVVYDTTQIRMRYAVEVDFDM